MTAPGRFSLPDVWLLASFLVPFGLFLSTLAPSVTFYDSGEFISAIHAMGSAHSPGYPLFLLYAKPFTWLPFGSIAFRVNVATAVSAALACLGVFLFVRNLLWHTSFCRDQRFSVFARNAAAFAGALLFAVSPRLWLQTNHDKPYPLLAFMVAMAFICLLQWRESLQRDEEQPVWWYAVGFIAGLATGAHQTIVLLIPAWIAFVLSVQPRMYAQLRDVLLTAAAFVLGGAIQLYLPLRAAADTHQNWGDPKVLSRFLWHLLRRGYPEDAHGRDLPLLLKQLAAFSIPHEFGWVGLLLLLIGVIACWQAQRSLLLSFGVAVLCYWSVIAGYFNPQRDSIFLTEEFYTPLYLIAAVLIAVGLYALAAWGAAAAEQPEQYGKSHLCVLALFFLLLPVFQGFAHYREQDQHRNYIAHDYGTDTIRSLPEDAVLFTWGDSGAFPLWYLQGVERLREDIDLPHIPHLGFAWYRQDLPRLKDSYPANLTNATPSELIFAQLAGALQTRRPVLMDYSTRHSIQWGGLNPIQEGILFWVPEPESNSVLDEKPIRVWDWYAVHRYAEPGGWKPDMDSEKALMIVGHSMLLAAEDAGKLGEKILAKRLFDAVEQVVPAWQVAVDQLRRRYDVDGRSRQMERVK